MKEFSNLTSNKVLTAQSFRCETLADGIPVIVQDGKEDLNQIMLDKGYAERKLHKQVNFHL